VIRKSFAELPQAGPTSARGEAGHATVIGDVGDMSWFASRGHFAAYDPGWLRLVRTCRPLSGTAARSAKPCGGQSPEGHEVVAVVADFKSGKSPTFPPVSVAWLVL